MESHELDLNKKEAEESERAKDLDAAMSELSIDMETLRQAIYHIAREYPRLDYDTISKQVKEEL